jgi:glycosyltransferase involved in cell wall biosynthesis
MDDPTLAVVTVNRNNRSGLIRTIDSFAAQTYRRIRMTVIDGQSSDGSVDYLRALKLPLLQFTSEADRGIYHAMQKGLLRAGGDAVIFLNSGDSFYAPNTVEEIVRLADLRHVIVLGRTAQTYKGDIYVRPRLSQLGSLREFPAHQGAIVPTAVAKTVPFDEKRPISADTDWVHQCLKRSASVVLPTIISNFELGGVSNSARAADLLRWVAEESGPRRLIRCSKAWVKFFLRNALGQRCYYRVVLSRRCEFVRQPR